MDHELLVRIRAIEHAIETVYRAFTAAQGLTSEQADAVITEWVEKLRLETFPTKDPNISMLAADEIADAFERIFR